MLLEDKILCMIPTDTRVAPLAQNCAGNLQIGVRMSMLSGIPLLSHMSLTHSLTHSYLWKLNAK